MATTAQLKQQLQQNAQKEVVTAQKASAFAPGITEGDPLWTYGKNAATQILSITKSVTTEEQKGTLMAALDTVDPQLYKHVTARAEAMVKTFKTPGDQALQQALHIEMTNVSAGKIYNLGIKNKGALSGFSGVGFDDFLGDDDCPSCVTLGRLGRQGYGVPLGGVLDTIGSIANKALNPIEHLKTIGSVASNVIEGDFEGAFKASIAPSFQIASNVWDVARWGARGAWAGVKWIGFKVYKALKFVWKKSLDILKWLWDKFCDLQNASWHKALAKGIGAGIGMYFGGPAGAKAGAQAGEIGDTIGKGICGRGGNPMIDPDGQTSPGLFDSPFGWLLIAGGLAAVYFVVKE